MLSLVEEMEAVCRHSGYTHKDFCAWFDYYLEAPPEDRCYFLKGPDWLMLARHISPGEEFPEAPGDAWFIFHASGNALTKFFDCAALAYPLPYVCFARPLKGRKELQFFKWERIRALCVAGDS